MPIIEPDVTQARNITCPYCGYQFKDSWEVDFSHDECTEVECHHCDEAFTVAQEVSVTYSSYKKETTTP